MPKVHFFKLAMELGERPNELQKRLVTEGINVPSTSTSIDDETARKIRELVKTQRDAAALAAAAEPQVTTAPAPGETPAPPSTPTSEGQPAPVTSAPVIEPEPPAVAPSPAVPEQAVAAAPATAAAPEPAVETPAPEKPPAAETPQPRQEVRKFTHDGQQKPKKVRHNLLITPEGEGGLSPDAEFGIVKAAGIIPIPASRPPRPPRSEGGPQQGPRSPRPEGDRRPQGPQTGRPHRGEQAPAAGAAPEAPGGRFAPGAAPGKAPARGGAAGTGATDAKKKQKRTLFTDREKPRQPMRSAEITSTTIRSRRKRRDATKKGSAAAGPLITEPIIITGPITVRELCERSAVSPAQVISELLKLGVMATVNQSLDPNQAVLVLEKLGREALYESELAEEASWRLSTGGTEMNGGGEERPPVVTILGHVDHGKTTLLDFIRKSKVTESEFGGITQHIGAYQVMVHERKITFLDTPGHAAFTAMRARGANLTDIAVLVVAADDGIQPQTIEAIDHAKAAKVPIVVAINKIDVPDAQPEVVKQQLSSHGLVAEEWGGDTIIVPLSAKKGTNVDQLLDMLLLVSEVQELRAETAIPARGAVVESKLDKQRGPLATVLVQEGTLHVGDALVLGMVSGKIRAMVDDKGQPVREAGPATPVEITGLSEVPVAGDLLEVVDDERKAREIAEQRQQKAREDRLRATVSLQNLSSMVASGVVKDLNIILKTDVAGSIEAISQMLGQIEHAEIRVNIIHAGVGDITESDVLLASASQAIIVGFHVRTEPQARAIAEEAGIDVRVYTVIYEIVDDVKKAMLGLLEPVFEEAILGHAEVRAIFKISRLGTIAGSYVLDGLVRRGSKVRVKREGAVIHEGQLDSLKHLKEDAREMNQGFECGISLNNFNGWQEGDIVESYIIKESRRETL